jgi:SAM-dependent methyltransferase
VISGFKREELEQRYNVRTFEEDGWHAHCGTETAKILRDYLPAPHTESALLLNAGAGVYSIGIRGWREIRLDLFLEPLQFGGPAVCASIEALPFVTRSFGAIVCVGEVLGYCDPARALREFGRVISPSGVLICDFASSRCAKYWLAKGFGRTADVVADRYNGTEERTWVYDPHYISQLMSLSGFTIRKTIGTHRWSAVAKKLGFPTSVSIAFERIMMKVPFPSSWSYLTTTVAYRT